MDQDQGTTTDEHAARSVEKVESDAGAVSVETIDELLIEEISIDGMCGVY